MKIMPVAIVCNPERRSYRDANGRGHGMKLEGRRTGYVREDISDSLADALEACQMMCAGMCAGLGMDGSKIKNEHWYADADKALSAYRKAMGTKE